MANVLLSQSIVFIDDDAEHGYSDKKAPENETLKQFCERIFKNNQRFEIIDRVKLDLAMNEFAQGCNKPYLNTSLKEMAIKRKKITRPKINNFLDITIGIYSDAYSNCMNYAMHRRQNFVLLFYIQELVKEYKITEAKKYFQLQNKFLKQVCNHNKTISLTSLVAYDIAIRQLANNSAIYYTLGDKKKAKQFRTHNQKFYDFKRSENYPFARHDNKEMLDKHSAWLVNLMIKGIFNERFEKNLKLRLKPTKMLEYYFFEEDYNAIILGIALILIIGCGIVLLIGKLLAISTATSNGFNIKEFFDILIFGGVIPLLGYFVMTNIDVFSGRDLNITHNITSFFFQSILLITTVFVGIITSVTLTVKKYCKKNEVVAHKLFNLYSIYSGLCYLFLLFVSFPILTIALDFDNIALLETLDHLNVTFKMIIGIAFLVMVSFVLLLPLWFVCDWRKKYRIYKILLTRKLLFYLSIIPLMIALIHGSVIRYQEQYYIAKDDVLIVPLADSPSSSMVEINSAEKMLDFINKNALKKKEFK